jgi:hypothetical protein
VTAWAHGAEGLLILKLLALRRELVALHLEQPRGCGVEHVLAGDVQATAVGPCAQLAELAAGVLLSGADARPGCRRLADAASLRQWLHRRLGTDRQVATLRGATGAKHARDLTSNAALLTGP